MLLRQGYAWKTVGTSSRTCAEADRSNAKRRSTMTRRFFAVLRRHVALCSFTAILVFVLTPNALSQEPNVVTFTTIDPPAADTSICSFASGTNTRRDVVGGYCEVAPDGSIVGHGYLL